MKLGRPFGQNREIKFPPKEYSPKEFVDREAALDALSQAVQRGNCLLVGMPKVGKTWLLRRLEELLKRRENVIAIYLDRPRFKSFGDLCIRVLTHIEGHDEGLLTDVTKERLVRPQVMSTEDLLGTAMRARQKGLRIYLLLDHFPVLTDQPNETWDFINNFENCVEDYKGISYVLAGNFSLYHSVLRHPLLAQRCTVGKIAAYVLPCLNENRANRFLTNLRVTSDDKRKAAWAYTGGHPYLLYVIGKFMLAENGEVDEKLDSSARISIMESYDNKPEVYETLKEWWNSLDRDKQDELTKAVADVSGLDPKNLCWISMLVKIKEDGREEQEVLCEALKHFVLAQPRNRLSYYHWRLRRHMQSILPRKLRKLYEWWTFELWFRGFLVLLSLGIATLLLAIGQTFYALLMSMLALSFALALARLAWRFSEPLL